MRHTIAALSAVFLASAASNAAAQSTGMPVSAPPVRSFDTYTLGATVSDPGSGVGFEGWGGFALGPGDVTIRAGLWDPGSSVSSIFLVGADYRQQLVRHSESFPMDGSVTVGLGGNFVSGSSAFLIPVGFSLGRKFQVTDSEVQFQPYGQPLVHFVFGDGTDDVLFSIGLGLEVQINDQIALDVNGMLGDLDGISIGFAYLR